MNAFQYVKESPIKLIYCHQNNRSYISFRPLQSYMVHILTTQKPGSHLAPGS